MDGEKLSKLILLASDKLELQKKNTSMDLALHQSIARAHKPSLAGLIPGVSENFSFYAAAFN